MEKEEKEKTKKLEKDEEEKVKKEDKEKVEDDSEDNETSERKEIKKVKEIKQNDDDKESKKEWERNIRKKINDNRNISEYLSDVDAMDSSWSIKGLLCKMTAIFDISKSERNSNLRSVIILAAMYLIGIILLLVGGGMDSETGIIGYFLMGAASAWKLYTIGSDVDRENERMGNVSYSARTDMFGQVKIEKNPGYVGCVTGILGLAFGVIITPILIIKSFIKYSKSDKSYKMAQEIVTEMEDKLKVRFTWNKKTSKWEENVL